MKKAEIIKMLETLAEELNALSINTNQRTDFGRGEFAAYSNSENKIYKIIIELNGK